MTYPINTTSAPSNASVTPVNTTQPNSRWTALLECGQKAWEELQNERSNSQTGSRITRAKVRENPDISNTVSQWCKKGLSDHLSYPSHDTKVRVGNQTFALAAQKR